MVGCGKITMGCRKKQEERKVQDETYWNQSQKQRVGMCGRYYIDENAMNKVKELLQETDTSWKLCTEKNTGDVHPSEKALVLTGKGPHLSAEWMQWGFPQKDGKGLLINARAETVSERVTFRESVLHRRCVIPARHYYEWNRAKEKVTFMGKEPVLYMAGLYQRFGGEERFVILTTQANLSVSPVHDRMPLLLEENEVENWIYEDGFMNYVLQKTPCMLKRYQEYEQQEMVFGA